MTVVPVISTSRMFEIRFRFSILQVKTMAFPCDARGKVDMDLLSEASRRDYLFVRIMKRRECVPPEVVPSK